MEAFKKGVSGMTTPQAVANKSHEEAVANKQSLVRTAAAPTKIWRHLVEPNPTAAVNFLNLPTAQVAGEAFASNRADGQVDLYYFL